MGPVRPPLGRSRAGWRAGSDSARRGPASSYPAAGRHRYIASGVEDFDDLESAAARAIEAARAQAEALARRAGAAESQISISRKDKVVREKGGLDIFIESRIAATAFGRPRLAH